MRKMDFLTIVVMGFTTLPGNVVDGLDIMNWMVLEEPLRARAQWGLFIESSA